MPKLTLTRKPFQQIMIGDDVVITVTQAKRGTCRLQVEAPLSIRVRRGELPPNGDEWVHGPFQLEEGRLVQYCGGEHTGNDPAFLYWSNLAEYVELSEAKQDAEFAKSEGRTVRVIDSSGTVVYEPDTECKTCEGDEKVPCCKCGGTGESVGSHPFTDCYTCNGKGDVPCPDCVEVDK